MITKNTSLIKFICVVWFLSASFPASAQATGTLWKCSYPNNKHVSWNKDAKANVFAKDEWYFIPNKEHPSDAKGLTSVPDTFRIKSRGNSSRFGATEEFYQKLSNAGGALNGFNFIIIFSSKLIIQTLNSSQASMNASDATSISQDPTRRGKCELERLSSYDEMPPQNYVRFGNDSPTNLGTIQKFKDAMEICYKLGFIEKTEKFSNCVSSLVD